MSAKGGPYPAPGKRRTAGNLTGSHLENPVKYDPLLYKINLHQPGQRPAKFRYQTHVMCPLCSEVRTTKSTARYDPETGICVATKSCAARRRELDDETIESLGLMPRGAE